MSENSAMCPKKQNVLSPRVQCAQHVLQECVGCVEHVSEGLCNGVAAARGVLSAAKYFEEFWSIAECFEAILQLRRGLYMFREIHSVFGKCVKVHGIIFQSSEARWTYQ